MSFGHLHLTFQIGPRVGGSANYSMDKGVFSFLPYKLSLKSVSADKPILTSGGHSSYQRGDRVSNPGEKAEKNNSTL